MKTMHIIKGGKSLFFLALILILAGLPAAATISATKPKVATKENQTSVEQGATFRMTIQYKNDTSKDVKIAAAKIFIEYDKGVVDAPPKYENKQSSTLGVVASGMLDTDGQIKFDATLTNPSTTLNVKTGETIDLLTLIFHVKKTATAAPGIQWWTKLSAGKTLNDYVYVKEAGDVNVTPANAVTPIDAVSIVTGAAPTFSGIDTLYDGDKPKDKPSVGNTVTLDWAASGANADDLTFYSDGKLRYHLYRDAVKIADFTLGNAGDYLYRDGDASGIPATGLNDGTTYAYKASAADNTDGTTNPDDLNFTSTDPNVLETASQTVTPTDTTAPSDISAPAVQSGDQKLSLTWTNPSDKDLGGIIIIRGDAAAIDTVTLKGADKTTYKHGEVVKEGDALGGGKVIFAGNSSDNHGDTTKQGTTVISQYTDSSGLVNGKKYYYKIIAYDYAAGETAGVDLVQMGRNYSAGAPASGTPGVEPDAVTNFYAISRTAENEITLRWDNSTDASKPQGGTIVWYTKDKSSWSKILADSTKIEGVGLFTIQPKTGTNETMVLSQDAAGTKLSTIETYFFAAFGYNETGVSLEVSQLSSHKFSSAAWAAAMPSVGLGGITLIEKIVTQEVGTATTPEVTLTLKKKTDGFGINTFVFSFSPIYYYDEDKYKEGKQIKTVADLTSLINNIAGEKVVSTFGYWDKESQQMIGFVYNDDGSVKSKKGTDSNPGDISLEESIGYQIYVTKTVASFTLTGKKK